MKKTLFLVAMLCLLSSVFGAPPINPPVPYDYPFDAKDPNKTLLLNFNSSPVNNYDSPSHQAIELWRASYTYIYAGVDHVLVCNIGHDALIQTWVKMMPECLDSVERDSSFVIASHQGTSSSIFEWGVTNDRRRIYWQSYLHRRIFTDSLPDLLDGLYHYFAVAVTDSTTYDSEGIPTSRRHRIRFYLDRSCIVDTVVALISTTVGYVRGLVMGGVRPKIDYMVAGCDSTEHRWPGKMCAFFVSADSVYSDAYFQTNWDRFEPIVRFDTPVVRMAATLPPPSIFPNPVRTLSALQLHGFGGVIQILNVRGQAIFSGTPEKLSGFSNSVPSGLYIIRFGFPTATHSVTRSVIITR